jgi:purine-binding chemotaxis protein CheW
MSARSSESPVEMPESTARTNPVTSGEAEARRERNREVLRARARALAIPLVRAAAEEEVELVLFSVGGERFAVESRFVCEVFPLAELAPIPGARPPLAGITGWRGDLLTLFDLRHLSAGAARPLADLGRVVVIGDEVPAFGILADAVEGLERRAVAAIHVPPDGVARDRILLRGVTDDAVRVLDGAALLRELH